MAKANFNLVVVPGTYDDLGQVLSDLGYEYQEFDCMDDACQPSVLKNCKVVFVACGADCSISDESAKLLRNYVKNGGAIYASDLAYDLVDTLFPGKAEFDTEEYEDGIRVNVVDPGLTEILGRHIHLHHDTEVTGVDKVSSGVKVLIKGPRWDDEKVQYPYLIVFNHGDGQVIYTVFHNSEQVSETEKKLLNYLIFRPIMAGAAGKAAQLVQAQMATPGKEIFASINPGETSARYGVNVSSPVTLLFVLSWEEKATLAMQVWDPQGKQVKNETSGKSPLTIEVPASQSGTWTCAIQAQSVPHRNFPYVLTIATRSGKLAPASPSAVVASTGAKTKHVPVYLVVDTSRQATDVLNPLLVGLRQFEVHLRSRAYRQYAPRISVIAANDGGQILARDMEISQYTTPMMTAQGKCNLGKALNNLTTSLAAAPPESAKPLVIVLLAGPPSDDWANQAGRLYTLASQGKANVFVFGLGGYADASVLTKLAVSAPLVVPIVTQVYAQQIFDWLYTILDIILNGMESGAGGQRKNIPLPPACVRSIEKGS